MGQTLTPVKSVLPQASGEATALREPQPRYGHAAIGVGEKLYVWGGCNDAAKIPPTILECYDVPSGTWEQQQTIRGFLPEGLRSSAVATDGQNAYTFGGKTSRVVRLRTIYQVNPSTLECKELVPRVSSAYDPKRLSGSTMVYFNQKLVVHGGSAGAGMIVDLHVFDLTKSEFIVFSLLFLKSRHNNLQCIIGRSSGYRSEVRLRTEYKAEYNAL